MIFKQYEKESDLCSPPRDANPLATRAEINLGNLIYNYHNIKAHTGTNNIISVVKADAYGHGSIQITQKLIKEGCTFFAVARLREALELRDAGISEKILIFGRLWSDEIRKAIEQDISITLTTLEDIKIIEEHSINLNKTAKIHINIDTGMGRVGILPSNIMMIIHKISNTKQIEIEGIYTHFATSDTSDKKYATKQINQFLEIYEQIKNIGIKIPYIHSANSGAILDLPYTLKYPFNTVRPGIILYGHYPSTETSESIHLKQVMTLKTNVIELRNFKKNKNISYGLHYTTMSDETIAVLPIGYADGINRQFTNKGKVLINDTLYPIVGTVTMDQIMVKVDSNVKIGDEVIFWGSSNSTILQASIIAEKIGTISYELCCAVTQRVPRIYLNK